MFFPENSITFVGHTAFLLLTSTELPQTLCAAMATATCRLSEDQFLCCICLDLFTDPVSTPCGHSFCKKCIDRHWNESIIYKCPICKEAFNNRPVLRVNIFISEIAHQFRLSQENSSRDSEQQAASSGEILCDVCFESKQKALKSCLVCLTSYCDTHLKPHRTMSVLKTHQLIEPQGNLQERVCAQHNKPLELFCLTEEKCVCVMCAFSDHRTHEIAPLKDAFDSVKQKLMKTDADIQQAIKTTETNVQEAHRAVDLSHEAGDTEVEYGVEIFTTLRTYVDSGLNNFIEEISRMKVATQEQADRVIKDLEQDISEMKKQRAEIEQLLRSQDHLHLLQQHSHLKPQTNVQSSITFSDPSYDSALIRALTQLEERVRSLVNTVEVCKSSQRYSEEDDEPQYVPI